MVIYSSGSDISADAFQVFGNSSKNLNSRKPVKPPRYWYNELRFYWFAKLSDAGAQKMDSMSFYS